MRLLDWCSPRHALLKGVASDLVERRCTRRLSSEHSYTRAVGAPRKSGNLGATCQHLLTQQRRQTNELRMELIPFAVRVIDGQLVDVHDVPRGLKANCVCPSCRTPLLAKQGDQKSWHFAHATRGTYRTTEKECRFSLFASIRLMARQIIGEQFEMRLPACAGTINLGLEKMAPGSRRWEKAFTVSPAQTITLENVRVEATVLGTTVDIVGVVNDYEFLIYLEHPGRAVPEALLPANLSTVRAGVVAIDLRTVTILFEQSSRGSVRYQELLLRFLKNDANSKRWIYHPRFTLVRERAIKNMERAEFLATPPVASEHRDAEFECVVCRIRWVAPSVGLPSCPRCRSHLYSRRICPA